MSHLTLVLLFTLVGLVLLLAITAEATSPVRCGSRSCSSSEKCVTSKSAEKNIESLQSRIAALKAAHKRRVTSMRSKLSATLKKHGPAVTGAKFTHACEGSNLHARCPSGYAVEVLHAFYGRRSNKYCAKGPRKTYSCSAGNANAILRRKCNGRRSCTVGSSNSVFGDPCGGTYKYGTLRYRCKRSDAARKKHSRIVKSLKSKLNRKLAKLRIQLKIARRDSRKCVPKAVRCGSRSCSSNEKCVTSKSAEKKIKSLRSRIAASKAYHKKMISKFRITALYTGVKNTHACKGSRLRASCPSGYEIQVLHAFYGRVSNKYCAKGPWKTSRCIARNAFAILRRTCNGRRSCSVGVSNSMFGDPCPGTDKYGTLKYRCKRSATWLRVARRTLRRVESLLRRRLAHLRPQLKKAMGETKKCVANES